LIGSLLRAQEWHRAQRPGERQRHVLVRIPDVALLSVVGLGVRTAKNDGQQPLEELVQRAEGEDEVNGEVSGQRWRQVESTDQDLEHRPRDQQSETEMDQTIVVIPGERELLRDRLPAEKGRPVIVGNVRVDVPRADDVQDQKRGESQSRDVRQREPALGPGPQQQRGHRGHVL